AIIVVVADRDPLSPAGAGETGLLGHVLKRPIPVVAVQPVRGRQPLRHYTKPSPVHQKNVLPPVVVIIEKGSATTGSLEEIAILVLIPVDRPRIDSGLLGTIDELNTHTCLQDAWSSFSSAIQQREQQNDHHFLNVDSLHSALAQENIIENESQMAQADLGTHASSVPRCFTAGSKQHPFL